MADPAHTPVVHGPSRIFLARHGQSEFNAEGRITGQLDPPLTAKGKKQAQRLARALHDERISAIYTSDLVRARETAAPTALAHGLPIRLSAALREIHLGVLQGRFRDERDPEAERLWRARASDPGAYRAPGGETFADLERRVRDWVQDVLQADTGAVLVVGHRTTNRAILAVLLGWSPAVATSVNPRNEHLYEITREPTPRIRTICIDERHAHDGIVE
jgi:broad specificity phosphatase PhoE